MTTRLFPVILACAALLGVASVAGAGDEKTFDLSKKDVARAGDVQTKSLTSTQSQRVRVALADGTVVKDTTTATKVTATWVWKELEVDAEGSTTKGAVYLKEWERVHGDEKDTSLKGALLSVTGRGVARAWAFLGPAPKASDAAKTWLDRKFGAREKEGMGTEMFAPKKPVALVESWTLDLTALVAVAFKSLPVDEAKSKGTGTLIEVDGNRAHVRIAISLPLTGMPQGPNGKQAPWTKGGTLSMAGDGWISLDGRPIAFGTSITGSLEGEASVVTPEATASVSLTMTMADEETVSLGGEIPEPAKPAEGGGAPK